MSTICSGPGAGGAGNPSSLSGANCLPRSYGDPFLRSRVKEGSLSVSGLRVWRGLGLLGENKMGVVGASGRVGGTG